jgi:hypothetical protein
MFSVVVIARGRSRYPRHHHRFLYIYQLVDGKPELLSEDMDEMARLERADLESCGFEPFSLGEENN